METVERSEVTGFGFYEINGRSVRYVLGNAGDNALIGSGILMGEGGNDTLTGSDSSDELLGGTGQDALRAESGDDVLRGGDGNDQVWGGTEGDTLSGGAGDDWLAGESGNDVVEGGEGNDIVGGQDGNDTLSGGAGHDQLWGGAGSDRFDFSCGTWGGLTTGVDTIKDFGVGDVLYFANASRMDILNYTTIYAYGSNTYITFDGGDYLVIENWTNASLVRDAIRGSTSLNQWNVI
jgi:Ca2+-binding RTX toxin-like protein